MLFMMNLDSTVGVMGRIEERSGNQNGTEAMLKICVALNKEKEINR